MSSNASDTAPHCPSRSAGFCRSRALLSPVLHRPGLWHCNHCGRLYDAIDIAEADLHQRRSARDRHQASNRASHARARARRAGSSQP